MKKGMLLRGTTAACFVLLSLAPIELAAQKTREPAASSTAPKIQEEDELRRTVGAPIDPRTYVVGPEDILRIFVWGEPSLSGPVLVRPDGLITLPLLDQDVKAGGQTPRKLAEEIVKRYEKIINKPVVSVSVATVNSRKYFVLGEVSRPGQYPLVVPTTVMQALAIAGGLREFANAKNIVLIRGSKQYKVNYKDVIRGKNRQQDIYVESGDMISVP